MLTERKKVELNSEGGAAARLSCTDFIITKGSIYSHLKKTKTTFCEMIVKHTIKFLRCHSEANISRVEQ